MKYDEKALEAAWQAYYEPYDSKDAIASMQAAISAYCEKAGVVMVPIEPTQKMMDAGDDSFFIDYDGHQTALSDYVYRAMIRASQEEE